MLQTMPYRGPDDRGSYSDGQAALGHLRLSIIDLSADGRQPMKNKRGNLFIIFNGEIYNYIEIRKELESRGRTFRSHTDTEVILQAYEEWGEATVSRFNGMWAFAIWDSEAKKLFCSRDRFGVKPLFYFEKEDTLVFASEMKALFKSEIVRPKPNETFLYNYLDRSVPFGSDEAVFRGIKVLPTGHNLVWENGISRISRHWTFDPARFKTSYDYANPVDTFRNLLIDSIKLRLRSDVPVGVCLSGGVDSSVIVGVISKILGRTVDTFSSVYREKNYTEEEFVDAVNVFTGARAHKLYPAPKDFFPVLDKLIHHHDEPVRMPSTFSHWHVFQAAKGNVIVTLDGQGADELLGGYRYYYPSYLATLARDGLRCLDPAKLRLFFEARRDLRRYVGTSYSRDTLRLLLPDALVDAKRVLRPEQRWQETVLNREFIERAGSPRTELPRMFPDEFTQHLFETFSATNLPMILDFEDRISMAFSLEARVPFLDYRLVEFCFGLPYEAKMHGYRNKTILRDAFKDVLPEAVYNRKDKKGFPTPNEHWFRKELKKDLGEIFSSASLKEHGVFDQTKVLDIFKRHIGGENHERILWRVMATELWMRKYFHA